ncbi:MAG: hypothetical protein E7359_00170 [Clostridiales bacterium]|nr:hypothetical protein [Clostridiales bacterium]
MAIEKNKLEELMYISLIGKFDYKHIVNDLTYLCYTSNKEETNKNENIKPVYITSTKVVSDKIALNRINAFEKKIFDEQYKAYLDANNEKLSFTKRIKDFINVYYINEDAKSQKEIVKNYRKNMLNLVHEEVVNKEEFEAAIEYVLQQFNKVQENVH